MSGDSATVNTSSAIGTFDNANVGTAKVVSITGVAVTGTDAGNYSVTQPSTTANITQASANLTWNTPAAITFGATIDSSQLNATAGVPGAFVYTPAAGTRLDAGTQTLSVTFTPDSGNYAVATTTVNLTVNRKSLTIASTDVAITYGDTISPSFTQSGLVTGDAASSVTNFFAGTNGTSYSSSTNAPSNAGTYSITPSAVVLSSGNTANYNISYTAGALTIARAVQRTVVAVAASTALTYSPAPSKAATTLSITGGDGDGAVTYRVTSGGSYCSIVGTTLTADNAGSCSVVATKGQGTNYLTRESDPITINIAQASQTLTFNTIADKTYGDGQFSVTPSATSGLSVVISSSTPGVCDVPSALTIRILSNGTCTISARQDGDSNYLAATPASGSSATRSFTIAQKNLTIIGASASPRTYDATADATSLVSLGGATLVGVVGSDAVAINSSVMTAVFASKNVGSTKPITVSGIVLSGPQSSRYTVSQPTGIAASINRATVTTSGIIVPTRAYSGSTAAILDTTAHTLTGVFAGDDVSLDTGSYSATFSTPTVGTAKAVSVSGLALSGADAGNYNITQPALTGDIVKANATVNVTSSLSLVYNANSRPVSTNTTPGALNVTYSYAGSSGTTYGPTATAPTNAGTYSVIATINDQNYQGTTSATFVIAKRTVAVALDQTALAKTFTGVANSVAASTTPAGKNLVMTYSGQSGTTYNSQYAPTNAGTYAVTATVNEQNFDGTSSATLVVAKATQAPIVLVNALSTTFDAPVTLVAVGGSGTTPFQFNKVSGPCTLDSNTGTLTPSGVGSCVVNVSRGASENYLAGASANATITIAKASQTMTFASTVPPSPMPLDTYTPTATSTSGLSVSVVVSSGQGTVCSYVGGVVTFLSSGTCTVSASQGGDANYLTASPITQSIVVGKINQSIAFAEVASHKVTDAAFPLDASASSGLDVTFAVTGTSSVCSVSNTGVVTPLTPGTCDVTVTQSGDNTYAPAPSVTRSVLLTADLPGSPHISALSPGDASITVTYTAPQTDGGSAIQSYLVSVTSSVDNRTTTTSCAAGVLTCTVLGLQNGTTYTVSVAAVNAAGTGPQGETLETTTPQPIIEAAKNVAGARTDGVVDVTWNDPDTFGDGTFVRYEVALAERGGSYGTPAVVMSVGHADPVVSATAIGSQPISASTTTRSYRFTGVDNTKVYDVKIVTVTSTKSVAYTTNTAAAAVLALSAPSEPTNVNAVTSDGRSLVMTWRAPASTGGAAITQYVVTSTSGSCPLSTSLSLTCTINGLTPGSSLTVTARAMNSQGYGAPYTATITLPSVPSAPAITGSNSTVDATTVTWRAPANNGGRTITSYQLTATNSADSADTFTCATTSLSCVLRGLKPGATYRTRLVARNSVGWSSAAADYSFDAARALSTVWEDYRATNNLITDVATKYALPPAPASVRMQSLSTNRTLIIATRKASDVAIPVTYALISVTAQSGRLLARIKVAVDPANPKASITVPYKSSSVKITVQFANEYGVSPSAKAMSNIIEANTFDTTVFSNTPTQLGTVIPSNLYFDAGKSTLTPALQKALQAVAAKAKKQGGLVYVTGYAQAGELKSAWLLGSLSRARAMAVSRYLSSLGVRQWINFQGAGVTTSSWGGWRDRKVVVSTGFPESIS